MNMKEILRQQMIDAAVESYKRTGSLRKTAEEIGVHQSTVGKMLITAGVYESSLYKRIKPLLDEGMTDDEIAEKLGVTRGAVSYNRPYKIKRKEEEE